MAYHSANTASSWRSESAHSIDFEPTEREDRSRVRSWHDDTSTNVSVPRAASIFGRPPSRGSMVFKTSLLFLGVLVCIIAFVAALVAPVFGVIYLQSGAIPFAGLVALFGCGLLMGVSSLALGVHGARHLHDAWIDLCD